MVAVRSEPVATDRLKLWRRDPVAFCYDVFPDGERPNVQQEEILWGIRDNKESVCKAHRGWGKSRTAAYAAHWWNSSFCALTLTLSPVWKQGLESIWIEIRHLWAVSSVLKRLFPQSECLTAELKMHPLIPKWRITSSVAHKVDTTEGRHSALGLPTLVIADESKNIGDPFRVSVDGMLSHPDARFFGISTPGIPFGWFYQAFASPSSTYRQFSYSALDSPRPEIRAAALKARGANGENEQDASYRQMWLAEFSGADQGVIIPLSLIEPACGRQFDFDASWTKVFSVDPAGGGPAHSVCSYIWGPVLLAQESWRGWDVVRSEKQIADRIKYPETRDFPGVNVDMLKAFGLPDIVVIDEGGLGQGTVPHTRLNLEGYDIPVIGYVSGSAARDHDRYLNRKAEDVYALRDRFKENATIVTQAQIEIQARLRELGPDPPQEQVNAILREGNAWLRRQPGLSVPRTQQLVGQIASWTAGVTSSGKTKVIDPEPSPDNADSALMGLSVGRMPAPLSAHRGLRTVM